MDPQGGARPAVKSNGKPRKGDSVPEAVSAGLVSTTAAEASGLDLNELLDALQSMRQGQFSVRLRGSQTGLAGAIRSMSLSRPTSAWPSNSKMLVRSSDEMAKPARG